MFREHAAAVGVCLAPLALVVAFAAATMGPAFWLPPPYPAQPASLAPGPDLRYAGGVQESTLARTAHSLDPYGYGWHCCHTSSRGSSVAVPGGRVVVVHSHLDGPGDLPDRGRAGYFYIQRGGDIEVHETHASGDGNPDVAVANFRGSRERVTATVATDSGSSRRFETTVQGYTVRRWNGVANATTLHVTVRAHRVSPPGADAPSPVRTETVTVALQSRREAVLVVVRPDGNLSVRRRPPPHAVG